MAARTPLRPGARGKKGMVTGVVVTPELDVSMVSLKKRWRFEEVQSGNPVRHQSECLVSETMGPRLPVYTSLAALGYPQCNTTLLVHSKSSAGKNWF